MYPLNLQNSTTFAVHTTARQHEKIFRQFTESRKTRPAYNIIRISPLIERKSRMKELIANIYTGRQYCVVVRG